jgi:hypothetical protein
VVEGPLAGGGEVRGVEDELDGGLIRIVEDGHGTGEIEWRGSARGQPDGVDHATAKQDYGNMASGAVEG